MKQKQGINLKQPNNTNQPPFNFYPSTIFFDIAVTFLVNGLEKIKKKSIQKDSGIWGYTQGKSLSEQKREIATKTEMTLGKLSPQINDEKNKQMLLDVIRNCRQQAKNLSDKEKKDEGTFGPHMQLLEIFLMQFYDILVENSGYCLLKMESNPSNNYEEIVQLTGTQKAIIYCTDDGKFYYKHTIKKVIDIITIPNNIEQNLYEFICQAHLQLANEFNSIPCKTYKKATSEQLNLIHLMINKKACQFLDINNTTRDSYELQVLHMALYLANVVYQERFLSPLNASKGVLKTLKEFVKKMVTTYVVPPVEKIPEIVEALEICNSRLASLDENKPNYQATRVTDVLKSLRELSTENKELVKQAKYRPTVEITSLLGSSFKISMGEYNSAEGRLGALIKLAIEVIETKYAYILHQDERIVSSSQKSSILKPTNMHPKQSSNSPIKKITGIQVLPKNQTPNNTNVQYVMSHPPMQYVKNDKFVSPSTKSHPQINSNQKSMHHKEEFVDEEYVISPNNTQTNQNITIPPQFKQVEKFEDEDYVPPSQKTNQKPLPRNCNVNLPILKKTASLSPQSTQFECDEEFSKSSSLEKGESELILKNNLVEERLKNPSHQESETLVENGQYNPTEEEEVIEDGEVITEEHINPEDFNMNFEYEGEGEGEGYQSQFRNTK